jgi:hypothetical protein
MNKEKTLKYLEEFAKEADQWFAADEQKVIFDNYDFLQTFFQKDYLEKLEWEDVQEMGRHLHAFHGNALAKQRAFGRPNHSIEHYRKVFNYLVSGDDDIITKLQDFYYNPDYTIDYFGPSAQSEIAGNIFPEQLIYNNLRDRKAAEFLGIDPGFVRGDNEAEKLLKFSRCLDELRSLYIEVVGQRTQMPLNIEIDQFFSYLYEKHIKNRAGVDQEKIYSEMLQLVNKKYPEWKGFRDELFVKDEINYKKAIIRDAQEILSENEYKNLLVEENYDEIYNKIRLLINHKQNNLLHYAEKLGDKYLFNDPGYENFVKSAPFCNNLYNFLFGDEDVCVRLEKFIEFLKISNIELKWTWPTYLLFLYNPENSIFVKPKVFRWFLNLFNLKYSPKPSSALYREILDKVSLVKEMFDVYEPEDMVDIQSLIYVCHGASRENDESDIEEENQSNDLLHESYQADSNLISQNFQNIFNFYLAAKSDREIKTKVKVFFKDSERILKRFLYDNFEHYNLKVDHSIGKGRMAEVPWFAFLDTKITTTTRKGVYCAFLFHPNMEGVYLTFMLGAGVYQQQPLTKNDITDISEISAKFRRLDDYVSLRSIGFKVDHNIDLGSQNTTVKAFEQATIAYKYYPKSSLNNDTLLLQDLSNLLEKTLQSFEKPEVQSLIQQMLGNQHDIEESDQPSYWLYSPGENASKWEEFKDEGIIAIGWDGTGDFSNHSTREELLEELMKIYAEEKDPSIAAKMCFIFYRNMKIGDYVFCQGGNS